MGRENSPHFLMIKILLLLTLLLKQLLFACAVNSPDMFSLSISTQTGDFLFYDPTGTRRQSRSVEINNCEKVSSSKKFLMIAFGPENREFSDRIGVFDFTNDYRDSNCFIKNSPFLNERTFFDRKNELQRRWKTIKSCFKIELHERVSDTINLPLDQKLCRIDIINKKTVHLTGGVCFVKPFANTNLELKILLNDDCRNYEDLRKIGEMAYDLEAVLNFYISGDSSGTSIDLNSVESIPLRMSFSPESSLIPLSDDMGGKTPQFPSLLEIPDIHLGSPEITQLSDNNTFLKPFFWIDHQCSKKCKGSFCQSICDYAQPFFGEFRLFEVQNNQKLNLISSWFNGSISRPKFQGEISGGGHELEGLFIDHDKTFRLEVSFTDPKFDYEEFRSDYLSKIEGLPSLPEASLSNSIPDLPIFNNLRGLTRVPDFVSVPEINFSESLSKSYERFVQNFSNYFNYRSWPPYYDKVCNQTKCLPLSSKAYLKLGIEFKILPKTSPSQDYPLEILRRYRSSPLITGYDDLRPSMPELTCPF